MFGKSGPHTGPIATVLRDMQQANQEAEFPRGRDTVNLFLNSQWEINKESYEEQFLQYDSCNIEKGGQRKSIHCAFKRVSNISPK